ncbi:type 2 lanthipeptide synthetase LanM family protein [Micromonospora sp. NPDC093277]|uniref:type 2 lanthipeptide synthetase LanM family protein n=1 Tax=Micromonospora sp. NPDC093277 TaxID=3364291 RepID=UPI00382C25F0
MSLLSTATGEGSATDVLGPQWWARALAPADGPLVDGADSSRPGWVDVVEQAVAVAAAHPAGQPPAADEWPDAFAVPLRPFLAGAEESLAASARRHLAPEQVELRALTESFTAVLARRLARIAARTIVRELEVARAAGDLVGADGRQRFTDFIARLSTRRGLVALVSRYPVLARLLGTASQHATEAAVELLARFGADRAAIVGALLDGMDPGPVVAVRPGLGDPHRRGRSVSVVEFADGRQVIYRPRSPQALARFGAVVGWFNERVPDVQLRTPAVLARPGYGWIEFVAHQPLDQPGQAADFYRREGMLLAALYATRAIDIHCENLIASADQPVLIDVETLFHPLLPAGHTVTADPAAAALAASVRRTGLLPYLTVGEYGTLDFSGMGGDPGETRPDGVLDWDPPATDTTRLVRQPAAFPGAQNRPYLGAEPLDSADHEAAVLAGFRLGYDAIVRDRAGFTRLLEECRDVEIRVVARRSGGYARLLDDSTGPDLLGDVDDWDKALNTLREASAHHPLWRALAPYEIADLRSGDIPLLTSYPGTRDVWAATDERVPDLLDRSGLAGAVSTVEAMDEVDRGDQEWIISASLAARRPVGGHRGGPALPGPSTVVDADPGRLLAAACGLADQIVARGMTQREADGPAGRVNWIGLQAVEDTRWMVLPMGASLGDGYLGVALFLAQLAELTGIARYAEVARRAVGPVPALWTVLGGRPDLLSAIGCGGTTGLGGIAYGLARMSTLLGDATLREWAETAVELSATAAPAPAPPGWTTGSAGCLAAMAAVRDELGSTAAARLAEACADRLVELVERTDGRCAEDGEPVLPGFATGPAGIGWALARFAESGADPRYARAAWRAVARAGAPAGAIADESYGWCSGAAGLLIARTSLIGDPAARSVLPRLADRPVLRDLSLCHGELGVAEALIVAEAAARGRAARQARRRRAGQILAAINQHAAYCGTPGGIATPGLLNGLAGIGYGLLRLGFAERVPSVLLLQPTPRKPAEALAQFTR